MFRRWAPTLLEASVEAETACLKFRFPIHIVTNPSNPLKILVEGTLHRLIQIPFNCRQATTLLQLLLLKLLKRKPPTWSTTTKQSSPILNGILKERSHVTHNLRGGGKRRREGRRGGRLSKSYWKSLRSLAPQEQVPTNASPHPSSSRLPLSVSHSHTLTLPLSTHAQIMQLWNSVYLLPIRSPAAACRATAAVGENHCPAEARASPPDGKQLLRQLGWRAIRGGDQWKLPLPPRLLGLGSSSSPAGWLGASSPLSFGWISHTMRLSSSSFPLPGSPAAAKPDWS